MIRSGEIGGPRIKLCRIPPGNISARRQKKALMYLLMKTSRPGKAYGPKPTLRSRATTSLISWPSVFHSIICF
ncbi:hypothetical protein D3C76_1445870 [compost metagenome]